MTYRFLLLLIALILTFSCKTETETEQSTETSTEQTQSSKMSPIADEFADIAVIRYDIPGWDQLNLKEKKLVYYLSQAGMSGRDIIWDQNYRHNLAIRTALETIYGN